MKLASTLLINVALGDQLTSVLGQSEVVADKCKLEKVNFMHNDATIIGKHIARRYTDIPTAIVNAMVRYIIWDLRYGPDAEDAVLSYNIHLDRANTLPQVELQKKWIRHLENLERLSRDVFS